MASIKKSVIRNYKKLPQFFSSPKLCKMVQQEMMQTAGKCPMDGTILRRLRETRADGITPYAVFDQQKSIYQKPE